MGERFLGLYGRATNYTGQNINVAISGKIVSIRQGQTASGQDVDGIILDGNHKWKLPDGRIINGKDCPKDIFKFHDAQNVTVTKRDDIFEISISPIGNGLYLKDGSTVVFEDWASQNKKEPVEPVGHASSDK